MLGCIGGDDCCTPSNKCGEDEGDCDSDNDCQGGLKCGTNNCQWGDWDDCCYKPPEGTNHFKELWEPWIFYILSFC